MAPLIAAVWHIVFDLILHEAPDPATSASLRSISASASGAWRQAIPSSVRIAIGNAEILSALRLRLGLEDPAWPGLSYLYGAEAPSVAHVLMCGFGTPGRITVHGALCDTVAAIAALSHYQVHTEAVGHLSLRPGETACR